MPQATTSAVNSGISKAHLHVALRAEVVDLVGPHVVEERGERTPVGEIGVVKKESGAGLVEVLIDVIEPIGVKARGAAFETVDLVAFGEQELGQVGAVLTGAAGD